MALRLKKKKQEEAGVEAAQRVKRKLKDRNTRWDWKALVKIFRLYYN